MKRGKIVMASGVGITAVVVILSAVVMARGLSSAAETRRVRDRAQEQLEGYYRRNPFPDTANVERERTNLQTVQEWFERLFASLQDSNIPMEETKPSVFNGRRELVVAELIASAPSGEGGARVVSDDFAFGFDRYKTGVLANPRDVPRLMRQLQMIELLVQEMYAAGVLRIASVSREEFEGQVADVAGGDGGGRRGGRRSYGETAAEPTAAVGSRIEGVVPLDRQRFVFELTADEESLVELLNRIARMRIFAVVTRLSLAKDGPDYVLAPVQDAAATTALPGGAVAPAASPTLPPLSRTARLVSGRDREARLKASLNIDVYSFEEEG